MRDVYQFSYCNIAATDARDSAERLFFDRPLNILETVELDVRWTLPDEGESYNGRFVLSPEGLVAARNGTPDKSPLNNRGWVLQEQLMAPRTVSFSRKQLMWFCCEYEACEAFPTGLPIQNWQDFEMGYCSYSDRFYHRIKQPIFHSGQESTILYDVWENWRYIVSEYTSRSLTFPTDKLFALNGIAQMVAWKFGCRYLAGIIDHKSVLRTFCEILWYPLDRCHHTKEY